MPSPADLLPDTVGKGEAQSSLAATGDERRPETAARDPEPWPAEELALMQRMTSNGYVRNKLTVLHGGAGRAPTAAALALADPLPAAEIEDDTSLPLAQPGALRLERIRAARIKGYEGDSCGECGNFTLIRNGTCLKCNTCGATSAGVREQDAVDASRSGSAPAKVRRGFGPDVCSAR